MNGENFCLTGSLKGSRTGYSDWVGTKRFAAFCLHFIVLSCIRSVVEQISSKGSSLRFAGCLYTRKQNWGLQQVWMFWNFRFKRFRIVKDSGALPDDLCLNYVRLDFANNNDNTSFSRHLSHEKIIVMMMMTMIMMTMIMMTIYILWWSVCLFVCHEKSSLPPGSLL